ncbi:unnamed protein product [Zymoseptoria tritici ST99CH_3D7]|uniref:Uncharacterized protein n=1 Tax=Zymoseptoria tritici (strain ST99CH_3D7) TaxID=1276538 RepID=A0A1X7S438_ZYMT9|nr:unnamed protein product [Zymoseptoria tritici ST99CH_3D7]
MSAAPPTPAYLAPCTSDRSSSAAQAAPTMSAATVDNSSALFLSPVTTWGICAALLTALMIYIAIRRTMICAHAKHLYALFEARLPKQGSRNYDITRIFMTWLGASVLIHYIVRDEFSMVATIITQLAWQWNTCPYWCDILFYRMSQPRDYKPNYRFADFFMEYCKTLDGAVVAPALYLFLLTKVCHFARFVF